VLCTGFFFACRKINTLARNAYIFCRFTTCVCPVNQVTSFWEVFFVVKLVLMCYNIANSVRGEYICKKRVKGKTDLLTLGQGQR
jgi:hypothetical protein